MNNELSPIQNKLLEIIEWFDAFCNSNKLRYYIIGGTMLGAVRHQGFIPWDDDIDVGMPRKDYNLFLSLTEGKINDHYTSETYHSGNADYVVPHAKIYDVNTTLVETRRVPCKRGVYIDLFPLDGVSDSFWFKLRYKIYRVRKNLLAVINSSPNEHRSSKKNVAIKLARLIPCYALINQSLQKRIEKFCSKYDFDESEKVANILGSRKETEVMPKEFFGTQKKYHFENLELYGPEMAHEYLAWLIGDYMMLPPESERFGHFIGYYDLETGYKS